MGSTLLALAVAALAGGCGPAPTPASQDSLAALYRSGQTFEAFLEAATRRTELWRRNYGEGVVPEDVVARARAVDGRWHLLVVAEDWCSDSVNTIPFLALLADAVPAIELRVIGSEAGQEIMETHRTPDGRAATPTVVVLDAAFREAGCWVERPATLQRWALENQDRLGDRFMPEKMAWYRDDAGRSTLDDVVGVIEAAGRGEVRCGDG